MLGRRRRPCALERPSRRVASGAAPQGEGVVRSYGRFVRAAELRDKKRSPSSPRRLASRSSGQEESAGGVRKRDESWHAVRSFRQSPRLPQLPSFVHFLFSARNSDATPGVSVSCGNSRQAIKDAAKAMAMWLVVTQAAEAFTLVFLLARARAYLRLSSSRRSAKTSGAKNGTIRSALAKSRVSR
jgi:hypothetical protein